MAIDSGLLFFSCFAGWLGEKTTIALGGLVTDNWDDYDDAALSKLLQRAVDEFTRCASSEERRAALCRYLRRGALAGLTTGALVDHLGVSARSVLERAGYSDDLAQLTMEQLGTISDEEILQADCD